MNIIALVIATTMSLTPCKGVTKKGDPCKSVIVNKEGYCRLHDPSAKRCPHVSDKGKPCGNITGGKLCRFHQTAD